MAAVAYQRLCTRPPLRAAFGKFLQEIARNIESNPAVWEVLGIEIINQPFGGDVYSNPSLFLPGVADRVNLAPFYEEVAGPSVQPIPPPASSSRA